jgi:hypothetical protein
LGCLRLDNQIGGRLFLGRSGLSSLFVRMKYSDKNGLFNLPQRSTEKTQSNIAFIY